MLYDHTGMVVRVSAVRTELNLFRRTLLYVSHPTSSFIGGSKGTLTGNIARYYGKL